MRTDPISAGLTLANTLAEIAKDVVNVTPQERIEKIRSKAQNEIENFKSNLVARNLDFVNFCFNGLPKQDLLLSESDYQELRGVKFLIDGETLLALYSSCKASEVETKIAEVKELR